MKQLNRLLWVILILAGPTVAAGQESPSVNDLTWLAGCWQGDQGEECWLPPKGGSLIGINRGSDGGSFEFLRIIDEGGELVYWASPGGDCPATAFRAIEVSHQRVVFANPEHDFPQKIAYWVDAKGILHARVSAETEGEEEGFELTWARGSW